MFFFQETITSIRQLCDWFYSTLTRVILFFVLVVMCTRKKRRYLSVLVAMYMYTRTEDIELTL